MLEGANADQFHFRILAVAAPEGHRGTCGAQAE